MWFKHENHKRVIMLNFILDCIMYACWQSMHLIPFLLVPQSHVHGWIFV